MKKSDNTGRPCVIMTGFTSYQLCFLEPLFRLPTQDRRTTVLELLTLVIVRFHNTRNDVGCFTNTCKKCLDQFVAKEESQIEVIDVGVDSAISLMKHWIIVYNEMTSKQRPTAKLKTTPARASARFQNIYKKIKVLRQARSEYERQSISTLGDFANSASIQLRKFNQQSSKDEDEDNMDDHFKKLRALVSKRLTQGTVPELESINVPEKDPALRAIFNKATNLVYKDKLNSKEMEFLKLCTSRAFNFMNTDYRDIYRSILDQVEYDGMIAECEKRRVLPNKSINDEIDNLFKLLLKYQFDDNPNSILQYIDEQKSKISDKSSSRYKLLRTIQQVVYNFNYWKNEHDATMGSYSKSMYLRKFASLLDILFEDRKNVVIYDGETVCGATRNNQILNGDDTDNGRRIDLLSKTKYNGSVIEICSTEFKKSTASTTICNEQQSKNIRINSSIAYNIYNITKAKHAIQYMGWRGRSGYMAQLFFYNDIIIAHQLDSLYIPKQLLELNDFKHTLKQLYAWQDQNITITNDIKLAAFNEQKKFQSSDMATCSSSDISNNKSPLQSPSSLKMPFLSPKQSHKRKERGE